MIRKIIFLSLVSVGLNLAAQDSLRNAKFKLFDIIFYASAPIAITERPPDLSTIGTFAKNKDLMNESAGYSTFNAYNENYYSGVDGGLLSTFKLTDPKNRFQRRITPRIGIYYSRRTLFNYYMGFNGPAIVIDTLKFTNPNVSPVLIDSTSYGRLTYKYFTEQVLVELGCNIDILTFRYFNFYAGLSYGHGFNFNSELSVKKHEYSKIDKYPDQKNDTYIDTKNYTLRESSERGFLSIITVPIGMQHRFIKRWKFSPGIFAEVRPGCEIYQTQSGPRTFNLMLSMSGGLRLSLQRHK